MFDNSRMAKASALLMVLVLCAVHMLCCPAVAAAVGEEASPQQHLRQLFDALDKDQDGQLHKPELKQAISLLALQFDSSKLDGTVEGVIGRLDSAEQDGVGVSQAELEQHLRTVMQDTKVAEWVAHGLDLPQYAQAFRDNSITALDLPMLVNDGGKLLQTELKVESPLHRQQLLRAMQRQILGLGAPPGPLPHLTCAVVQPRTQPPRSAAAAGKGGQAEPVASTAAAAVPTAVDCSWQPPADLGQPALHKYVLQRVDHAGSAVAWETVAELQDSLSMRYRDTPPGAGSYQYRLTAWNLVGRSPYVVSTDVILPDSITKQDGSEAVSAPGCGLDADTCHPATHGMLPAAGQAATGGLAASVRAAAVDAGRMSSTAMSAAVAAGGAAVTGSSSNSSKQPAAAARLVALLGSIWHSSMGGWVKALVNTLTAIAILVLPICVRLLPVHVLSQAAQVLARLLQFLPRAVQQRILEVADTAPTAAQSSPGFSGGTAGVPNSSSIARRTSSSSSSSHSAKPTVHFRVGSQGDLQPTQAPLQPAALLQQQAVGGTAAAAGAAGTAAVDSAPPAPVAAAAAATNGIASAGARTGSYKRVVGLLTGWKAARATPLADCGSSPPAAQPADGPPSTSSGSASNLSTPASLAPATPAAGYALQQQQQGVAQGVAAGQVDAGQQQLGASAGVGGDAVPLKHRIVQQQQRAPGAAAAAAVATSSGQPRAMPRSVSDFDLVRQATHTSSGLFTHRPRSSAGSPLSSSPMAVVSQLPAVANNQLPQGQGLGGVAGLRFASTGAGWPGARAPAAGVGVGSLLAGSSSYQGSGRPVSAGSVSGVDPAYLAGPTAAAAQAGSPLAAAVRSPVHWRSRSQEPIDVAEEPGWGAGAGQLQFEDDGWDQQCFLYASQLSSLPDNKRCSFPGCQQQFGLRQWKATLQRHYCGRCQQAFCLQHTAYSPHGTNGTCGVQSRCLCIDCFYEYTPEYQAFLASRNTLVGKRSKSGPPASAAAMAAFAVGASADGDYGSSVRVGSSGRSVLSHLVPPALGNGSSSSSSVGGRRQQQQSSGILAPTASSSGAQQEEEEAEAAAQVDIETRDGANASATEDTGATDAGAGAVAQPAGPSVSARQRSLGAGATVPAAACSKGLKSRMLWGRGLVKALGVVRFRHAGDLHATPGHSSSGQEQPGGGGAAVGSQAADGAMS